MADLPEQTDLKISQNNPLLKILVAVNEKILDAAPYEKILDFMFDSLRSVIPFDRIGIAMIEAKDGETRLQMNWVKSDRNAQHLCLPYSTNTISPSLKKIIDTNEPRIINDLFAYLDKKPDSVQTQLAIKDGIRSSLTCPIRVEQKAIGVIFFSSFTLGTYQPEHIEIFQHIATEISVIIRNSQLQQCQANADLQSKNVNMTLHDLRSPLGVLQGFAEISLDSPWFNRLESEARTVFQTFFRNTKYMLQMVNELSELALLKRDTEKTEIKANDLASFLKEIAETGQQLAQQKEILFKFFFSPQLPLNADFDAHKLKRVILNLFSNAVKFSNRKSEIIFRVGVEAHKLLFSVEDQGQGIPQNEFGKLFQEFGKTSVRPTEGEVSTGQGLAISKKFVELHHGQISVASRSGHGSTFSFWIPTTLKKVPALDKKSQ